MLSADSPIWTQKFRPSQLDEIVGNQKAVNAVRTYFNWPVFPHLVFYGPPGSGKTSFAQIIQNHFFESVWLKSHGADFSVKEFRLWATEARQRRQDSDQRTVVFIDEIHRLTKSQQDVMLEPVERFDLTLIGATTENPSAHLARAILSRVQILRTEVISEPELLKLALRVFKTINPELPSESILEESLLKFCVKSAYGDARRLIQDLQNIYSEYSVSGNAVLLHDWIQKSASERVEGQSDVDESDTQSAMIKSIRGSDPKAALFWMNQLLEGGMNPLAIARRMIVSASEDIGNAEPRALGLATAAYQAVEFVGLPEAAINLAQVVVFLACAPKSNSSYFGFKKVQELAKQYGRQAVPANLSLSSMANYKSPHEIGYQRDQQKYWPLKISQDSMEIPLGGTANEKRMLEYLNWLKGGSL